jgi:hypothetical protein
MERDTWNGIHGDGTCSVPGFILCALCETSVLQNFLTQSTQRKKEKKPQTRVIPRLVRVMTAV